MGVTSNRLNHDGLKDGGRAVSADMTLRFKNPCGLELDQLHIHVDDAFLGALEVKSPKMNCHDPDFGHLGPESSRCARSLAVWAMLRAYGRNGYREMIERHLDLAQRIARQVDEAPDLERLADAPLNIVCFRYHPPDVPEDALDDLNQRPGNRHPGRRPRVRRHDHVRRQGRVPPCRDQLANRRGRR